MAIDQLIFIVFFLLITPSAAALLASTITEGEIFAHPRAWVEAHCWPMFSYLLSCSTCMTHWTAALITLLCWSEWSKITFCNSFVVAFICWAAVTNLAIRLWLRK